LYSSPNIIRVTQKKENEIGGACGTYAGMHTRFRCENFKGKALLEDLEADWRIILKRILNK
jgi:hypothetical protein